MKSSLVIVFVLVNISFASPINNELQSRDFWSQLSTQISNALYPVVNQAVQDLALQITQNLADFANGGTVFGKRSAEVDPRFWNTLQDLLNQAIKPAIDNSAQGIAALLAQITAGVAIDGIPAITDLVGKRETEVDPRFWNTLQDLLNQAIKPAIDNSAQGIAALLAQITAGVAIDGIPAITDLIG